MRLDDAHCYQALAARDHRFDGVFYVGVTTTGIYCRPVCPARTPRSTRCKFFASAAAAERRGFRPCLRCRPELAPHARSAVEHAPVDIVRARAIAAGERIAGGALDQHGLDALAAELGISARHLERVVEREFGASPVGLAQTRRLLTAKQLLTETSLPMSTIAMASGFRSVRRFNALFQSRYGLAPGALRKQAPSAQPLPHSARAQRVQQDTHATDNTSVRVSLHAREPLDWPRLCAYLGARAMPGVECVDSAPGWRYQRVVSLQGHTGIVSITESDRSGRLRAELSLSLLPVLVPLLARLRALLDLDASPHMINAHLSADPMLAPLVATAPGIRVAGAMHPFELAIRAVLGQQVSVRGATTLAGRLVQAVSEPLDGAFAGSALTHAPFTASRLADASEQLIASIGLPRARARTVKALAVAVASGTLPALADEPRGGMHKNALAPTLASIGFHEAFTALPGIGPWTAEYVAMRALRDPDAFPDADLALRKAAGGLSASQLRKHAERWRPWRAYAAMHLWNSPS